MQDYRIIKMPEGNVVNRIDFLIKELWLTTQGEIISKEDKERLHSELDKYKENLSIATMCHYEDKYQTVVWN